MCKGFTDLNKKKVTDYYYLLEKLVIFGAKNGTIAGCIWFLESDCMTGMEILHEFQEVERGKVQSLVKGYKFALVHLVFCQILIGQEWQ